MWRHSGSISVQDQSCMTILALCSGVGGPTSFRKFKDEAAHGHPYGGSPLKAYPGPPYTPGTEGAREVEMNAPGGSTSGLHLHRCGSFPLSECTGNGSKGSLPW